MIMLAHIMPSMPINTSTRTKQFYFQSSFSEATIRLIRELEAILYQLCRTHENCEGVCVCLIVERLSKFEMKRGTLSMSQRYLKIIMISAEYSGSVVFD